MTNKELKQTAANVWEYLLDAERQFNDGLTYNAWADVTAIAEHMQQVVEAIMRGEIVVKKGGRE